MDTFKNTWNPDTEWEPASQWGLGMTERCPPTDFTLSGQYGPNSSDGIYISLQDFMDTVNSEGERKWDRIWEFKEWLYDFRGTSYGGSSFGGGRPPAQLVRPRIEAPRLARPLDQQRYRLDSNCANASSSSGVSPSQDPYSPLASSSLADFSAISPSIAKNECSEEDSGQKREHTSSMVSSRIGTAVADASSHRQVDDLSTECSPPQRP